MGLERLEEVGREGGGRNGGGCEPDEGGREGGCDVG